MCFWVEMGVSNWDKLHWYGTAILFLGMLELDSNCGTFEFL